MDENIDDINEFVESSTRLAVDRAGEKVVLDELLESDSDGFIICRRNKGGRSWSCDDNISNLS